MSNTRGKTFDAVQSVRTIRDAVSAVIAAMSVEDENRWLRGQELTDPTLRRLMARHDHRVTSIRVLGKVKRFETQLIDIFRCGDDGLAYEHWGVFDQFTMLRQLGVIPAGPSAPLAPHGIGGARESR